MRIISTFPNPLKMTRLQVTLQTSVGSAKAIQRANSVIREQRYGIFKGCKRSLGLHAVLFLFSNMLKIILISAAAIVAVGLLSVEAQICRCVADDVQTNLEATKNCCPYPPYGSHSEASCDVSADSKHAPLLVEEYKSCCIDWDLTADCK